MDERLRSAFARFFPQAKVELKFGIERRSFPLIAVDDGDDRFSYRNDWIELRGAVQQLDDGMRYTLRLVNIGRTSTRITRLRFPAEGGLGGFLEGTDPRKVAFLRNGYQSWSTTRSYRITDKPLRPRFHLVSLASSNMANLPSNSPGQLSSEMYSVIMDLESGRALLVGQETPFDQFFYVILNIDRRGKSYFELIYDFGRQLLEPGKEIELDSIVFRYGTRPFVEQSYFWALRERLGYTPPARRPSGWCSWYEYYTKLSPEALYKNLKAIAAQGPELEIFQIDDGWQTAVGDWLEPKPAFAHRMRELADAIRSAGMRPGLWFAPFSAAGDSELARLHPEYVLKNEYGRRLPAGYNPYWKGFYYGLDVTHPRFAEYLREVVRTIVEDWGFEVLKCDFLFSACLRGACHHDLSLSRAQVLKEGMRTIRQAAGADVKIMGCGMPLSAGIGLVDSMRVGPDTGDFWIKLSGKLLRTGAMIGARNSLRNFMVRSPMHKRIWLNDPDCAIIRDRGTRLSPAERRAQLDAIALSGGALMYSDDFSALSATALADLRLIDSISAQCYKGQAVAIDLMEQEIPEIYYNTSGYVAFFNFSRAGNRRYDLSVFREYEPLLAAFVDLRSGERLPAGGTLVLPKMPRHGSRLFRIERNGDPPDA